jgi:hypothetical protein
MRTDGHDEADSRFLQFCERLLKLVADAVTTFPATIVDRLVRKPAMFSVCRDTSSSSSSAALQLGMGFGLLYKLIPLCV